MTDQDAELGSHIDLQDEIEFVKGGIVSKVIVETKDLELDLFCISAGQGLSEHTAATDAIVEVVRGEGTVSIGDMEYLAQVGSVFFIPAKAPHALKAKVDLVFLLTLPK